MFRLGSHSAAVLPKCALSQLRRVPQVAVASVFRPRGTCTLGLFIRPSPSTLSLRHCASAVALVAGAAVVSQCESVEIPLGEFDKLEVLAYTDEYVAQLEVDLLRALEAGQQVDVAAIAERLFWFYAGKHNYTRNDYEKSVLLGTLLLDVVAQVGGGNPTDAQAMIWFALGTLHREYDPERAVERLEGAVRMMEALGVPERIVLDQPILDAYLGLGQTLLELKNAAAAMQVFARCAALAEGHAHMHADQLAEAYQCMALASIRLEDDIEHVQSYLAKAHNVVVQRFGAGTVQEGRDLISSAHIIAEADMRQSIPAYRRALDVLGEHHKDTDGIMLDTLTQLVLRKLELEDTAGLLELCERLQRAQRTCYGLTDPRTKLTGTIVRTLHDPLFDFAENLIDMDKINAV